MMFIFCREKPRVGYLLAVSVFAFKNNLLSFSRLTIELPALVFRSDNKSFSKTFFRYGYNYYIPDKRLPLQYTDVRTAQSSPHPGHVIFLVQNTEFYNNVHTEEPGNYLTQPTSLFCGSLHLFQFKCNIEDHKLFPA